MGVKIFIEGQRLDLHDDETITLKQSVQDVKDISKIFADFTQSFNVPASDNNNNIFKHYYNADVDGGYDARTRKLGSIDVDDLDFKKGKIRLDEVKIENGKPSEYKITFFGDAIKIKDLLSDDKLGELTWLANFNHEYSGDNVLLGLTEGLDFTVDGVTYERAIIYPMISYKRQWYYNDTNGDNTSTDTLVNIAYRNNRSDGIDSVNLKPAIKLHLIIKAIEEEYGITFNSPFFESQNFKQIYMNLNSSTEVLANGYLLLEDVTGTQTFIDPTNDRYRYRVTINPDNGFLNTEYKVKMTINGEVVYESQNWVTGNRTFQASPLQFVENYDCQVEVFSRENFEFDAETLLLYTYNSFDFVIVFNNTYTNQSIDVDVRVTNEMPDFETYDFLVGLFKMFNLTITSDGQNLYVEDLINWYSKGQIYDITSYVDTESETVKRGNVLKQIDFKFQETEQILADAYQQANNGSYYGNLEFLLADANGNPLQDVDGDTLEIETQFENPIFERLFDLSDGDTTSIQYCLYADNQIEAISEAPFLFYAPLVSVVGNPIGFLDSSSSPDVYSQINTSVFMPSHSIQIDTPSFNLNFNAEINEYTSQIFQDTIYKTYYEDYIGDIFSVKRRIYDYKAILPSYFLSILKLNDRLIIKDRRYIINSITSTLSPEREDRLELINDIYDAPLTSDTLNTNVFRQTFREYNFSEQTDSVTFIGNSQPQTIKNLPLNGASSFVTLTYAITDSNIFEVEFTLSENNTGSVRSEYIYMNDNTNATRFYITQYPKNVGSLNFQNQNNLLIANTVLTGKS